MTGLFIERARAKEMVAATSKNLKGSYKWYIQERVDVQIVAVPELGKRVCATGSAEALEQENLRVSASCST